jgi:hypothetical protein
MGRNISIRRADRQPLGSVAEVHSTLASVFVGLVFERSLTGAEHLARVAQLHIVLPDSIREAVATLPAKWHGHYEGANFSVKFYVGMSEPVFRILANIQGVREFQPLFEIIYDRYGWMAKNL